MLLLIIASLSALLLYVVVIYNRFIKLNNLAQEGWSGIDIQLKQRYDLIPSIIETVKGYMAHERNLLTEVTELRTQCIAPSSSISERANNENLLTNALGKIFAVAENYPDLKTSQNFLQLQESLVSIENQIQLARRYYNGTVRDFNILVQSFPSNLIANNMKFTLKEFFEIQDDKQRATPVIKFT